MAQSPNSFKYQAILRDGNGNIKASASANLRIDILQGSASGTIIYAETFAAQTNAFGLVNLEIGKGTIVSGNFSAIDWSAGPYFVKVSVDGTEMGTSQLLSVPYAMYAAKVANAFSGSYSDLTNKPTLFNGDYYNLTNIPTILTFSNYNTATGYYTLKNVTGSGSFNTAIGYGALQYQTSGEGNTAVGVWALQSDTSGIENTTIGNQSLKWNLSGQKNTASGSYALWSNTTGNNNTAMGEESLFGNTTGSDNIAIGYHSFYTGTGSENIVIGNTAGISATNLKNATAIGYGATVTASNNMVFGNSSVVGWGFGVVPGTTAAIKVGSTTLNGNGATLTLGGVWTNASDSTKKYNIQPIHYGLKEVLKLRPVSYQMKGTGYQDIGFIAQEVKLILPELVYGKEGELTLSYGQITAVLTKALQEQQKQIDELKQLVEKLAKK
jgi:carbonic anhydrase/acetyltransferase-like protein (isoleucine patch superfamily)